MIDTTLSSLRLAAVPQRASQTAENADKLALGSRPQPPEWMQLHPNAMPIQEEAPPVPVASRPHEEVSTGRLRMGLMLGLTALGAVAPLVMPAVAQAAPIASVVQTPVRASSVAEVVESFQSSRQLYVVGNPKINGVSVEQGELARLQEVLRRHPGSYVVLVDGSRDLAGDDHALSRGIANHPDFQKVVNPRTGERSGVVFMVYTGIQDQSFVQSTGKDRALFMRSEELPDRLGVGEANFADPQTGAPRELLQLYIQSFQQGKGMAGSLDAVMQRIDSVVNEHAEGAYNQARQAVDRAAGELSRTRTSVQEFQRQHGSGGQLGSPDVSGWQRLLERARQAQENRDLAGARALAEQLSGQLQTWQSGAAAYGQAGTVAAEVRSLIERTGRELGELEDNSQAQAARAHHQAASQSMHEFEVAYRAKDPSYAEKLEQAGSQARAASEEAQASRDQSEFMRKARNVGLGTATVVVLLTAFLLNHRARARGHKARQALDEATGKLGQRSAELLELLNRADYHKVADYAGRTRQLGDEMLENANEALMLVGGAEKFLSEARELIEGHKLKNAFSTANYDRALSILTDPEQKLAFGSTDTARVVLEKDSQAATWRDQILATGSSRVYEKSMLEVLDQIEQRRQQAEANHEELESKQEHIVSYLAGLNTRLEQATQVSGELVKAGGPFAAGAVAESLLPAARADMEAKSNDPVYAYDELKKGSKLGESAGRMVGEAEALLAFAGQARSRLLPALETAQSQVQGIDLGWARQASDQLSARLDTAARAATKDSAAEEIKALTDGVSDLVAHLHKTVELDQDRRGAAPRELAQVEAAVEAARLELTAGLQQLGLFRQGTPDRVLAEKDHEVNSFTGQGALLLKQAGPLLSKGSLESAGESLDGLRAMLGQARERVEKTRQALAEYPATSAERLSRHEKLGSEVEQSFERLNQTYAPEVQPLVAREIHSGENLAGCVELSGSSLARAMDWIKTAQKNADQAHLLEARQDLERSAEELGVSAGQLALLQRAESVLAGRQTRAEGELASLTRELEGLQTRSSAVYVRSAARELLSQAQAQLAEAGEKVARQPRDPYSAQQALDETRAVRQRTEQTMDADQQIYQAAGAAIERAAGDIGTAARDLSQAETRKFHQDVAGYGPVEHAVDPTTLEEARGQLTTAREQHAAAQGQMPGQAYEEGLRLGQASSRSASASSGSSASVVARFQAEFSTMVATAHKQVEMDRALPALEQRLSETKKRASAEYVRAPARQQLGLATEAVGQSRSQITRSQRAPYEEEKAVNRAEELRQKTEALMASDQKAWEQSGSAQVSAGQAIEAAEKALSAAERKTFSEQVSGFGEVRHSLPASQLAQARSQLQSAREKLAAAHRQHGSQTYEEATRQAGESSSVANSSALSTAQVVSANEAEFRGLVAVAKKQVEVQKELSTVEGRFNQTRSKLSESYVRSDTERLYSQATRELDEARSLVDRRPAQPDPARQAVSEAESKRGQVDRAIEADRQAYEQARSKVSAAEQAVSSAKSALSKAASERWSTSVDGHGQVSHDVEDSSLSSARSRLSQAESKLQSARSELGSKDYDAAARRAGEADSEADQAASAASQAVSQGKRRFEELVSAARSAVAAKREAEERARRAEREAQERKEAEKRRQTEAAQEARQAEQRQKAADSGKADGSSGRWNSGGGSGSTGGAW